MKRTALAWAAIVLAGLAAAAIRVVYEGRGALADGEAALAHGDKRGAILAFEAAARWYVPGAPHVADAYGELRALTGDPAVALPAWRAIRGAALASRWLVTPHGDDLAAANTAIAKLSAAAPGVGSGGTEAWQAARLARSGAPGPGAAAVAVIGIALWIGAAIALGRRRPAAMPAVVLAIGVALWAVGLYNA